MNQKEFEDVFMRILFAVTQVQEQEKKKILIKSFDGNLGPLELELGPYETLEDLGYEIKYYVYRQGEIGSYEVDRLIKLRKHKDQEIYIIEYLNEERDWNKVYTRTLKDAMKAIRECEIGEIDDMTEEGLYFKKKECETCGI